MDTTKDLTPVFLFSHPLKATFHLDQNKAQNRHVHKGAPSCARFVGRWLIELQDSLLNGRFTKSVHAPSRLQKILLSALATYFCDGGIGREGHQPAVRCSGHEQRQWAVRCTLQRTLSAAVSTGRRNTLVFLERWSVDHDLSSPDIFHRQAEVRDLGSMAARRVDEFDWTWF